MKSRSFVIAGLAAGLAMVSMPETVSADPPNCPPGLAKKDRCGQFPHYDRSFDRDRDFEDALDDAYEEGFRDGRDFRIGDRLSRDRYRILDRDTYYDRYGRRLDDRYYYAEADGERLLIEAATGAIVDLLLR